MKWKISPTDWMKAPSWCRGPIKRDGRTTTMNGSGPVQTKYSSE